MIGKQTSGEAEIVLVFGDTSEDVFVTVGSDHTDRGLETVDINKSKQVCDKPFASKAWKLEEVIDHWDELLLSSQVYVNGKWEDYQRHQISAVISYDEIKSFLVGKDIDLKNSIIFSGTVPLLNGFKYGEKFRMVFTDPVTKDEIISEYSISDISTGG